MDSRYEHQTYWYPIPHNPEGIWPEIKPFIPYKEWLFMQWATGQKLSEGQLEIIKIDIENAKNNSVG